MQSNESQLNTFVEYIRTKQFMLNALRNVEPTSYVHISMDEIKRRFLVNPLKDIQHLIEVGEIEIEETKSLKGYTYNAYKVLKAGYYDLNLLEPKGKELNSTTLRMMNILKDVSLKKDSPSTDYFNTFLKHKDELTRVFFNVDEFSGRVHTPITSFHRTHRPNILIDEVETLSIDVVTMQPLLLGTILKKVIGNNDFSSWIDNGKDIYVLLQNQANLKTRDEAKKKFFEILFSKPNDNLVKMFGACNWVTWINEFKSKLFDYNPRTLEKTHSNLAFLLQTNEVAILTEVWQELLKYNIKFLSVHDEIIVKKSDYNKARELFSKILAKYFVYFKLSNKSCLTKDEKNKELTPQAEPKKVIEVALKQTDIIQQVEVTKPNDLFQYAINLIGYNNSMQKNQIPYFEELKKNGIIQQAKPHNDIYYLSNSAPF